MRVLVLNTGSSSLKWALFEVEAASCVHEAASIIEGIGSADDRVRSCKDALDAVLDELAAGSGARIDAIGHRVVQGGLFVRPTIIDALVMEGISAERELAPLHNGPSLEAMAARSRATRRDADGRCVRHGVPRDDAGGRLTLRVAERATGEVRGRPLRFPRDRASLAQRAPMPNSPACR